eukprot:CAMPEP_0174262642 /NCGR_PEP_ID=MMETSP0439-20130205/14309_1 /TAXON_ID=0 /ORGANISM="Stereomyxa ramosa, Strain Chinc5" /LENGTH=592 /DNA_ID=CAMNT_0015347469 /DNA_START=183 /DNA_END=1961 /DNA_ORIENTATION=+
MKNDTGGVESHGLSLLDVVKHAVKTIIETLQPNDRIALVSFNSSATKTFGFTPMDKGGKEKASKGLKTLSAGGSTNLWAGLEMGLQMVKEAARADRNATIMLLTDGQPNVDPPGGTIHCLQQLLHKQGRHGTVNTFGFGYSLNSQQLADIAKEGTGMYSFIPDSSFVGTIFVNALGSVLSTACKNSSFRIKPLEGVRVERLLGEYLTVEEKDGSLVVPFGNLPAGEAKNLVVELNVGDGASPPYIEASLDFENTAACQFSVPVQAQFQEDGGDVEHQVQRLRLRFVEVVGDGIRNLGRAKLQSGLQDFVKQVKGSEAREDERIVGLLQDVEGQGLEATSNNTYYNKWGVHYLPSLARAHLLQVCNNFKDPGVQHYGGRLFAEIRDDADEIFCKLPPPEPTSRHVEPSQRVSSMSVYNCSSAPCFHGSSLVLLPGSKTKRVDLLKKGDLVVTPDGSTEVVCVVKTVMESGEANLVRLEGGLLVTPWHPVLDHNGSWCFPSELQKPSVVPCPAVYSFVLKDQHVMSINGVFCVSLGHSFSEPKVKHDYFGSPLVISHLKAMRGWSQGLVLLSSSSCCLRDSSSSRVVRLCQDKA